MDKTLKIGINARSLSVYEMRGFPRYVSEIVFHLLKISRPVEIYLFCNGKICDEYKKYFEDAKKYSSNKIFYLEKKISPKFIWQGLYLKYQARKINLDIFHSPINVGSPLCFSFPCPRILSLHDTITNEYYSRKYFKIARIWDYINYYIEFYFSMRCDYFVTVSESSKSDIMNEFGILSDNISVIYNGAKLMAKKDAIERKKYFLYLGGMEVRKNIPYLLTEFEKFNKEENFDLVLAGHLKYEKKFDLDEWKKRPWIKFIESPHDDEVTKLYQEAQAVILPSVREGFGLQIVEAYAQGTPVIHSSITAYKEIASNLGISFDPTVQGALYSALKNFLKSNRAQTPKQLQQSEELRVKYSANFSWENAAVNLLEIYSQVSKKYQTN